MDTRKLYEEAKAALKNVDLEDLGARDPGRGLRYHDLLVKAPQLLQQFVELFEQSVEASDWYDEYGDGWHTSQCGQGVTLRWLDDDEVTEQHEAVAPSLFEAMLKGYEQYKAWRKEQSGEGSGEVLSGSSGAPGGDGQGR